MTIVGRNIASAIFCGPKTVTFAKSAHLWDQKKGTLIGQIKILRPLLQLKHSPNMVTMTFIWWIYHFWARFWPYFNFVDFRAYFGPFSLVNRDRQKMADLLRKIASNKKMQENKPTLKFNFTIEKRWPVLIVELFGPQHLSHWALPRNCKTENANVHPFHNSLKWSCVLNLLISGDHHKQSWWVVMDIQDRGWIIIDNQQTD